MRGGTTGLSYNYGVRGEGDNVPGEPLPSEEAVRARDMVLLLMALSSAFLYIAFGLNWEINRNSFHVVQMSDILENLGPVESSIVALLVSAFVVALPQMGKMLPFKLTPWHIAAIIGGTLLAVYFIVGEPIPFLLVIVQTFVLVFYSAPLVFGLYGIIHHKSVHLVISAMFSLFIAGGIRNPVEDWPRLLVWAILFLLYLDVAECSVRSWNYLKTRKLSEEHLASYVERYLRNLAIFVTAGVLLSLLILQLPLVVGVLGQKALEASLELGSPYGQVASAVVVLGGIGLLRFLHDRGYTAPWIKRGRALLARLKGAPEPVQYEEKW